MFRGMQTRTSMMWASNKRRQLSLLQSFWNCFTEVRSCYIFDHHPVAGFSSTWCLTFSVVDIIEAAFIACLHRIEALKFSLICVWKRINNDKFLHILEIQCIFYNELYNVFHEAFWLLGASNTSYLIWCWLGVMALSSRWLRSWQTWIYSFLQYIHLTFNGRRTQRKPLLIDVNVLRYKFFPLWNLISAWRLFTWSTHLVLAQRLHVLA